MRKTTTILFILSVLTQSLFAQTIEELEYDLSYHHITEKYGEKINKAKLLQGKDPFNQRAIGYIVRYYYDRNMDSISVFFDQLIADHPSSAAPFILRAHFLSFELRNWRDSNFLSIKEKYLRKAISIENRNVSANYNLSELYYEDFLKPFKKEIQFGDTIVRDENGSIIKPSSVGSSKNSSNNSSYFSHVADSALLYLKKTANINPHLKDELYFSICQIERYKNKSFVVKLDSTMGMDENCYFPIWYFANLTSDWANDLSVDYLLKIKSSKRDAEYLKVQLEDLAEPCLNQFVIPKSREIYRFTWLRSFDPPIAVRIEKDNETIQLFWKQGKGAGGYAPKGIDFSGEKNLSLSEWETFMKLFNMNKFEPEKNNEHIVMFDGASWVLEKKTATNYKAFKTNNPNDTFANCCMFLIEKTGIGIKKHHSN